MVGLRNTMRVPVLNAGISSTGSAWRFAGFEHKHAVMKSVFSTDETRSLKSKTARAQKESGLSAGDHQNDGGKHESGARKAPQQDAGPQMLLAVFKPVTGNPDDPNTQEAA